MQIHSLLIARHGKLVLEEYSRRRLQPAPQPAVRVEEHGVGADRHGDADRCRCASIRPSIKRCSARAADLDPRKRG